jgi:hypothetical protein
MNWVVSKAMGISSAGEICDRRVEELLLHNGIKQHNIKMYKAEKSFTHRNFHRRYYIGDALIAGVRQGIAIVIDEDHAVPSGYICKNPLSLNRDGLYRQFMGDRLSASYPLMLGSYFDREITGAKSELKPLR